MSIGKNLRNKYSEEIVRDLEKCLWGVYKVTDDSHAKDELMSGLNNEPCAENSPRGCPDPREKDIELLKKELEQLRYERDMLKKVLKIF